jgi:uncharacterized protein
MPTLVERFTLKRPVDEVWVLFQDLAEVVTCMPGLELLDVQGPDAYRGRLHVHLGPISASFEGVAKVGEIDPVRHRASIYGKGTDKRGGNSASVVVTYQLVTATDGTTVEVTADLSLYGRIAQFGRTSLLEEVSRALTAEFASCLESRFGSRAPSEAAPAQPLPERPGGARIFLRALWSWMKRPFRRREPKG